MGGTGLTLGGGLQGGRGYENSTPSGSTFPYMRMPNSNQDAVNTASRMESSADPKTTQVTKEIYELLKDEIPFVSRGIVDVKGKGKLQTYVVKDQPPRSPCLGGPVHPQGI